MLAFCLPFILYMLTMAPTIYNLDSAELSTAAATLGITRPTGYPLYILLGHLWSLLPVGDVGFRLNLFSVFNAALTIALTERILRRMKINPWAVFVALGMLTCTTYFWAMALIAEVYSLQTVLMSALCLGLMRWKEDPRAWRAMVVGFLLGLGLCNHLSTLLLLPGVLFFVLWRFRQELVPFSHWLLAASGLLLGLCLYLYLPLRSAGQPAFNYAGSYNAAGEFIPLNLRSLPVLTWFLSGGNFKSLMFAVREEALGKEIVRFGRYIWAGFMAVGIGPGLIGIGVTAKRHVRIGGMLVLMFVLQAAFFVPYQVVDKETMLLPNLWIWSIWLGVGMDWMLQFISGDAQDADAIERIGLWTLRVGSLILVLTTLIWNWNLVNLAEDWSTRERGEKIMEQVEAGALVIGYWDTAPVLEYLQLVEGRRQDIQIINRFLVSEQNFWLLVGQETSQRPVYVDQCLTNLRVGVRADKGTVLYRLSAVAP